MDNKKWYKRFGTIFWWVFAILPLLIALIYFIGYHLTFNSGINSALELSNYHTMVSGDYLTYLDSICVGFESWTPTLLINAFSGLFGAFNVVSNTLNIICAWFLFSQIIHLLIDIVVFVFHKMHCLLERGA